MRGVEVEGPVVEHFVHACFGVPDADGGMPEQGVQFLARRAGQDADFGFVGELECLARQREQADDAY